MNIKRNAIQLESDDNNDNQIESGDKFCIAKETLRDMLDLESAEYAAQRNNQTGQELKILMSYQILSSVPFTLAQFRA